MKTISWLILAASLSLAPTYAALANCGGYKPPVSDAQIRYTYGFMQKLLHGTPKQQSTVFHNDRRLFSSEAEMLDWARNYVNKGLPYWLREEHVFARWYRECERGGTGRGDDNPTVGGAPFSGCNATNPNYPNCDERDCNATNPAYPNC